MEPRLGDRGKGVYAGNIPVGFLSSMEPRLGDRGKVLELMPGELVEQIFNGAAVG